MESYLGNQNTLKSIFRLAIPSMVGQLINVLYNIVDRIYVGNLPNVGEIALIGIGVCSPIVTLITSFAFLVGLGGAPMFSIALGEKDNDKAKKILSNALLMLIIISSIIMLIFYLFSEPILFLFGASEASIEYALSYLRIYLIGTFFSLLTLGLNQYLTAQGESSKAMMTIIIGCVLNIGLDPLFMYFFHLGVKGAALATIISQFISFVFVIFILLKKTTIKLSFGGYDKKIILMIIKLGISPFIIMATDSIILILLNNSLKIYGKDKGDFYIEIATIVQAFETLATGPLLGISSGTQPILGYNYGAKNKKLIIKAEKQLLIFALIFTSSFFILSFFIAKPFSIMFIGIGKDHINYEIVNEASKIIFYYMLGIIPLSFQYVFVDGLTGLGQAKYSIWLALIRKVVIFIPSIYLLPLLTNSVESAFFAEPICDIISAIVTSICYLIFLPKILKKIETN